MSLTTFVELPDVKQYLRLNVTKPWFQIRAEIKAPPLTTSYGWTGTCLILCSVGFFSEACRRNLSW